MRPGRLRAACLPLALAGLGAGIGAACSRGLPATGADAGGPDALVDVGRIPYDGQPTPEAGPRTAVHAEFVSTRVDTMSLLFAAGEMQTSGEPFAQNFGGRDLLYYDRYYIPVDQYLVPVTNGSRFYQAYTDLFGFSSAVESYEYSKYHVNMIAFETGAGVSLANGPLVAALPGATAHDKLRTRVEHLLFAAGTDVAGYAHFDGGTPVGFGDNPYNDLGFVGLWPVVVPYRSFDPSMTPDTTIAHSCTVISGYGGLVFFGNNPVNEYECAYDTLNLGGTDAGTRAMLVEPVIGPGTVGLAAWKYALWGIDFTGRLHDSQNNFVTAVAPGDLTLVGTRGNKVVAVAPPGAAPGVFVGSTPLEGMWGLLFLEELDNAAAWLLTSLGTTDGTTLSGFGSVAQAIQYDYLSPLVWYPTAIGVTEDATTPFPGVASTTVQDATSHAADLAALAQGYSLFFGMTDARNVPLGQQLGAQIEFGGSVFPADNGLPDGESSPHDRALGVMRTAFVDLDRMHVSPGDPKQVVADTATVSGGTATAGTSVTTTSLGHVVIGLRHLLMGCNAAVSQYGAPDPDPSHDAQGILNSVPLHRPQSVLQAFSPRVRELLEAQAAFARDTLTQADGTVANGATRSGTTWSPVAGAASLESQGAALRALVEGWLVTQDPTYQARAQAVGRKLLTAFWSAPGRMFRQTAGGPDDVLMTPERFAWLQQALRELYQAAWIPGDPLLDRGALEGTIARVNKLYLNGWDDLNGDQIVQKPGECLGARMQMGEQALTGEVATSQNGMDTPAGADRESDCVENIAFVNKGSLLASKVHFYTK